MSPARIVVGGTEEAIMMVSGRNEDHEGRSSTRFDIAPPPRSSARPAGLRKQAGKARWSPSPQVDESVLSEEGALGDASTRPPR